MQQNNAPSVLGGTLLIAGTTIGAGMLGLPTVSAGMWIWWSLVLMVVTWAFMLFSSQALLEVNLHYEIGDNFYSLVKKTLGPVWNVINGFSVAFVLYILLYAYISGGSSTVANFISSTSGGEANRVLVGIVFALVLSGIIWFSSNVVDRISTILVFGLVISFVVSMSGMSTTISVSKWLDLDGASDGRLIFMWAALSTYLTSFNFHCCVPSFVKYFGKDPVNINKSLIYGTFTALVVYTVWVVLAQGNISRDMFRQVIADGGNVGVLVNAASQGMTSALIMRALDMFAFLALITSFLGAGLGLFDYIADLCKFDDTRVGRSKTAAVTFLPPMIGGIFFPDGFISAIAWAGLFSVIWAVIIPALMLLTVRKEKGMLDSYVAYKGNAISYVLIAYGIVAGICHVCAVLGVLPMYS